MEWLLYILAKTPLDYTDHLLKPSNFAERAHVSETDYQRITRRCAAAQAGPRARGLLWRDAQRRSARAAWAGRAAALVIWGAEDNIVPLRDSGAVAEWTDANLRLIPNSRHWPQFKQTDITLPPYRAVSRLAARLNTAHRDDDDAARIRRTPASSIIPTSAASLRGPTSAPGLAAPHPRL